MAVSSETEGGRRGGAAVFGGVVAGQWRVAMVVEMVTGTFCRIPARGVKKIRKKEDMFYFIFFKDFCKLGIYPTQL